MRKVFIVGFMALVLVGAAVSGFAGPYIDPDGLWIHLGDTGPYIDPNGPLVQIGDAGPYIDPNG